MELKPVPVPLFILKHAKTSERAVQARLWDVVDAFKIQCAFMVKLRTILYTEKCYGCLLKMPSRDLDLLVIPHRHTLGGSLKKCFYVNDKQKNIFLLERICNKMFYKKRRNFPVKLLFSYGDHGRNNQLIKTRLIFILCVLWHLRIFHFTFPPLHSCIDRL